MSKKGNQLAPVQQNIKKHKGKAKEEQANKQILRDKRTAEIIRMVLALTPEVPERTRTSLQAMGYDFNKNGSPNLETMIQLMLAKQALQGDLNSIKFMYDYGLVHDVKADNDAKRIDIEREKVKGLNNAIQFSDNMQTIAELINNPQPDVEIEELTEKGRLQMEKEREKLNA